MRRTPTGRVPCLVASTMCTPANGRPIAAPRRSIAGAELTRELAPERRCVQRLAPKDRREQRLAHQIAQLPLRIGLALAERRAVDARPDAAPRRRHHDQPPARVEDAPDFLERRARILRHLQRVNDEDAIDRGVGQGQHVGVDQRRGGAPARRPVDHALLGRHEGEDALRLVAKPLEIGSAVAQGEDRQARAIVPAHAQHSPDQPARNVAERGGIEGDEIVDVERHGRLGLSERQRIWTSPRRGANEVLGGSARARDGLT